MVVLGGLSATIFATMKRNCIIAQLKRHAKLVRIIQAIAGFAKSRFANRKGSRTMQIEREFVERRAEQRRTEIRAGISQLFERRQADRRAANSRISAWIEKFERSKGN